MSEPILLSANGHNGQLELLENRIRITRKGSLGFLSHGYSGAREIQIDQISSINFKPAGNFANGYIQFTFLGGTQVKSGIQEASRDENAVIFLKKHQTDFEKIKDAVEEKIRDFKAKDVSKPTMGLDDLSKLAELKNKGIITEEEFQAKKKQILGL